MNIFDIIARAYPLIIQVIVLGHFIDTKTRNQYIYLFGFYSMILLIKRQNYY